MVVVVVVVQIARLPTHRPPLPARGVNHGVVISCAAARNSNQLIDRFTRQAYAAGRGKGDESYLPHDWESGCPGDAIPPLHLSDQMRCSSTGRTRLTGWCVCGMRSLVGGGPRVGS